MTDTITCRQWTVEEVALLRAVVHWRRAAGVYRLSRLPGYRTAEGAVVSYDTAEGEIGIGSADTIRRWYSVQSLADAVDLLVWRRFLPDQFSTSYKRGYYAGAHNAARVMSASEIDPRTLPKAA
jgi:hypothetical protein